MLITGATHRGLKRLANQDCFATGPVAGGGFAVVCDGMGGQQGGEVASRMACDAMVEAILRDFATLTTGSARDIWIKSALEAAAKAASYAIFELGESQEHLQGMGTTLVAALVIGWQAYILHAGDSRAYLLREGTLSQLTTDHTMVQMLLDRGDITLSESRHHPQRHYITRALGVGPSIEPECTMLTLLPGDLLLLCTDGLYNFVPPDALEALAQAGAATGSVEELIAAANAGGGGDNITAVFIGPAGEVEA